MLKLPPYLVRSHPSHVLDGEGRLIRVNRAWLKMMHCGSRAEVQGRFVTDFLHADSRGVFLNFFKQLASSEDPVRGLGLRMQGQDGTSVGIYWECRVSHGPVGKAHRPCYVFRAVMPAGTDPLPGEFSPRMVSNPVLLIILGIIALFALSSSELIFQYHVTAHQQIVEIKERALASRRSELRFAVERTITDIETERRMVPAETDVGMLKVRAARRIRNTRLSSGGYLWVNEIINYEGGDGYAVRRVHPNLPETEGMLLSTEMQDVAGGFPYREELEGVKSGGEIFFKYWFKKMGSDRIAPKLTFAKLYRPFDWIVAGGVYLDDIETMVDAEVEAVAKKVRKQIAVMSLVTILTLLAAGVLTLRIRNKIHAITGYYIDQISGKAEALRRLNESLETRVEQRTHELGESEKKYRTYVDSSPLAIFEFDVQGFFREVNEAAGALLGSPPGGLPGTSLFDRLSSSCRENVVQALCCLPESDSVSMEVELSCLDGSVRQIEMTAVALAPDRYLAFCQDITARVAADETVRKSEEDLRITLNSIGDAVICTDASARVMRMNPVAEHLTGWPLAEAAGRPVDEVFVLLDSATGRPENNPVERVLKSEKRVVKASPASLVSRTGKTYSIADSAAPIRDAADQIAGVVLVFRDVTDEHRLQDELEKMQRLESIGLLAGGIAHDFNNILMSIFGNIELAKKDLSPDHSAYESLSEAGASLQRAVHLTSQLLTFSRGGDPVKTLLDLAGLVKSSVCFDLSGSAVKPVFTTEKNLWLVCADPGQIQQVFSNLVINAKQSMPRGGRLYVALENVEVSDGTLALKKGRKYVKVSVRDEGSGIPAENLKQIFDPYFTTKPSGNGLGLAIVYSIVTKHGGRIDVDSGRDKGTCFTLYLPAAPDASALPAEKRVLPSVPVTAQSPSTGSGGRILVMDDDESICTLLVTMLESLGYPAEAVLDGEAAIALYRNAMERGTPFDAVIMDLTVPGGMGGREALEGILAFDSGVKAIVSSGYADDPIIASFRKYGFVAVAVKPYSCKHLKELLCSVLGD